MTHGYEWFLEYDFVDIDLDFDFYYDYDYDYEEIDTGLDEYSDDYDIYL